MTKIENQRDRGEREREREREMDMEGGNESKRNNMIENTSKHWKCRENKATAAGEGVG